MSSDSKKKTYYLEKSVTEKVKEKAESDERSESYIANKAIKKGLGIKSK